MIDFFDRLYKVRVQDSNKLLVRLRYYNLLRYLTRTIANTVLPIYFNLTKNNNKYKLQSTSHEGQQLIVSLTSFPQRINGVYLVIESVLRQTLQPDKIILWLSKEQFSDLSVLPKKLLDQQRRGLEIKLVDSNLRSHKKYIYVVSNYPEDTFITIDDDVIYCSNLLQHLKTLNDKFPNAICCNRAVEIMSDNNKIDPYLTWQDVYSETPPSSTLMPIGIGGVLYPPKSLNKEVTNVGLIQSLCFHADDIWLNGMARLNNTKIAKTHYNSHYLPVTNKNDVTLTTINVYNGENDVQLEAVRSYYINNHSIDPFNIKS